MITLTVGNSYSTIRGLSAAQEKELRGILSYTVGGSSAYFSRFGPSKKSLLSKRGEFPTGLLSYVHSYFAKNSLVWGRPLEKRFKPAWKPLGTVLDGMPYLWQINAVEAAIRYSRGIITAPTGTGKSRMIAELVIKMGLKTLVVVPSLEIKRQLSGVLAGIPNITVENIDSSELDKLTDFDCLIIDEGHHVAAKTYQKLNKTAWTGIYYRFFLTATPFRNDAEEQLLFEAIAGQVIYKLDYHTAIRSNYIVPVEAYYVEIQKQPTDAYTYPQVYKELVVNNGEKNTAICNLLTNLHASKKSTLCLVREVEHGKILSEITGLPFVSGEDEASRKYIHRFNKGEIKVLIGTNGIVGEGIDTKPCEYIIVAGLGKAKSQFMQQVGRSLRNYEGKTSAKVIIFKDSSHKFLLRHFNAQKKILLDEYGVKCLKLKV